MSTATEEETRPLAAYEYLIETKYGAFVVAFVSPNYASVRSRGEFIINRIPHNLSMAYKREPSRDFNGNVGIPDTFRSSYNYCKRTDVSFGGDPTSAAQKIIYAEVDKAVRELWLRPDVREAAEVQMRAEWFEKASGRVAELTKALNEETLRQAKLALLTRQKAHMCGQQPSRNGADTPVCILERGHLGEHEIYPDYRRY